MQNAQFAELSKLIDNNQSYNKLKENTVNKSI